jgi:hypothetical protein
MAVFIESKAQYGYWTTFIINDKDGYTNIRKEPNGKSEIVGKVIKYELFTSMEGCEDIEISPASVPWLFVCDNNNVCGYIYKKNIMLVYRLPELNKKTNFNESTTTSVMTRMNDSIRVSMEIILVDTMAYIGDLKKRFNFRYGDFEDEYSCPTKKLNKIIINYKDKTTILPKDKFQNYYYEIRDMDVYIGKEEELYIGFSGGGDASAYLAWFVIVNGEITQEFVKTSCW